MLTESEQNRFLYLFWGEGIVLMLVTPFLLFPTVIPIASVIALILVASVWLLRWRSLPVTAVNRPLLLLLITVLVACLVTADPMLTFPKATGVILGLSVWRYAVMYGQERWLWGVLAFLLLGSGFVAVGVMTAEWLNKLPLVGELTQLLPTLFILPEARIEGVQSNQLAGTILLTLPLSIAFACRYKAGWVLAIGLLGVLLLTQSRFGLFGLMSGVGATLLWFSLYDWSGQRWARWALGVGIVSSIGIIIFLAVTNPVLFTLDNWPTLLFREETWRWAWMAIGDFPFTGVGLGAFRDVVYRLYPVTIPETQGVYHAHNLFLQMALDIGLIGLGAYGWLMCVCGKIGWQMWQVDEGEKRPFVFAILITLIIFHAYGLGDTLALGSKTHLLFWGLLGLLVAMSYPSVESHSSL